MYGSATPTLPHSHTPTNFLSSFQRPAPGEDGEAAQEGAFLLGEEGVAPVQGGPERLVARTCTSRHSSRSRSASWAVASRRCSQLSSPNNSWRERSASSSVSSTARPCSSCTPRTAATVLGTCSGSESVLRSTNQTPSG